MQVGFTRSNRKHYSGPGLAAVESHSKGQAEGVVITGTLRQSYLLKADRNYDIYWGMHLKFCNPVGLESRGKILHHFLTSLQSLARNLYWLKLKWKPEGKEVLLASFLHMEQKQKDEEWAWKGKLKKSNRNTNATYSFISPPSLRGCGLGAAYDIVQLFSIQIGSEIPFTVNIHLLNIPHHLDFWNDFENMYAFSTKMQCDVTSLGSFP